MLNIATYVTLSIHDSIVMIYNFPLYLSFVLEKLTDFVNLFKFTRRNSMHYERLRHSFMFICILMTADNDM